MFNVLLLQNELDVCSAIASVHPHLEYCTAAWSPHYKKDKELLKRIQRRFTRMIPELKSLPYPDRLKDLGGKKNSCGLN